MADVLKFLDRTELTEAGCREWTGPRNHNGYGLMPDGALAHRAFVVELLHPITLPPEIKVCHTCDNPPCIRPDHLFLGTQAANIADMWKKGRGKGGILRGSQIGSSKLTEEDVAGIKTLLAEGVGQRKVAAIYGVSRRTVQMIHYGQTWRHVA